MERDGRVFEFTSSEFGRVEQDAELVNTETMHGHALISYLRERLSERGFATGEPIPEDWGWLCEIEGDYPVPVSFGCTAQDNWFVVQINPEGEYVRRLFRKIPVGETPGRLAADLFAIVAESGKVTSGPDWH